MKINQINVFFGVLMALPLCSMPAMAQWGTPKYNFQNRAQVEQATRKNLGNLRASHEVIVCAARQGMGRSAVRVYEQEVKKAKTIFDVSPQLCASYALAYHLVVHPQGWYWKSDYDTRISALQQSDQVRVSFFRDRAVRALPRSPEVLFMDAFWLENTSERLKARRQLDKAILYRPNWGELHYFYAMILTNEWGNRGQASFTNTKRYGTLILRSIQKAEKSDPILKRECLLLRSGLFDILEKPRASLAALDAYVRVRPDYVAFREKAFGPGSFKKSRDYKVAQARKSKE